MKLFNKMRSVFQGKKYRDKVLVLCATFHNNHEGLGIYG